MPKQNRDSDVNVSVVASTVDSIVGQYGFDQTNAISSSMGGWCSQWENAEFIVQVSQDRSGDVVSICLGSKLRRRPRAHLRGPWSLGHLRGYLDEMANHFIFDQVNDQLVWFEQNVDRLLDSTMLNSDELNKWAVNASRQMFGQKTR